MTSIPAILRGLNRARVRYLLICGSASAIHGVSRTTVDLDLLDLTLYPEDENVRRALGALREMDFIPETNRLDKIIGQGGVTATDNRDSMSPLSLEMVGWDAAGTWIQKQRGVGDIRFLLPLRNFHPARMLVEAEGFYSRLRK